MQTCIVALCARELLFSFMILRITTLSHCGPSLFYFLGFSSLSVYDVEKHFLAIKIMYEFQLISICSKATSVLSHLQVVLQKKKVVILWTVCGKGRERNQCEITSYAKTHYASVLGIWSE